MKTSATVFAHIFDVYKRLFDVDVEDYISNKATLTFPQVAQQVLENLCDDVREIFSKEPVVLKLPHDVVVIGDLHGHILDLFRILNYFGLPPARTYLFLGDIVDRGEFSTETITLVYLMKVLWPDHVFLIRGNHEFREMCQTSGFATELFRIYGVTSVAVAFLSSFAWIPLGAVVGSRILCIHGGVCPALKTVSDLESTHRPMFEFDCEPATSVLWSDPMRGVVGYRASPRGSGYFFGEDALASFLVSSGLQMVVRAHQCVDGGVEIFGGGQLATVFSASYYCGIRPNKSGTLVLLESGEQEMAVFPPLNYYRRALAHFVAQHPSGIPLAMPMRVDGPQSVSHRNGQTRLPHLPAGRASHMEGASTGRPSGMKLGREWREKTPAMGKRCSSMRGGLRQAVKGTPKKKV